MKKGWEQKTFENCIEHVEYTRKVQRKDFLLEGQFPVISQEAEFTNGFWDDEADLFKLSKPVIIFGDHTQVLKYVDFDFVLGADGVKILQSRSFLWPKFFFYQLQATELPSLGYARHYRLLKELVISIPPLSEQQRIVGLLDEAFGGLATAQAHAAQNLQNARDLFESHLNAVFTQRGDGWVEKRLGDIGTTQTGSTPKTSDLSNYGSLIPFIKPGDFNPDGTLDYENEGLSKEGLDAARRVAAKSVLMVCIGATIGKCGYCNRDVTTNQQINALTPLPDINHLFMYFQMLTADFQHRVRLNAGQATLPIISKGKWNDLTVVVPASLDEQKHIAAQLDALSAETQRLTRIYEQKLAALAELKKSLLHLAFNGEL
jgi:hypothetical protein